MCAYRIGRVPDPGCGPAATGFRACELVRASDRMLPPYGVVETKLSTTGWDRAKPSP